jgi:hypothetical protein
MTTSMSYVFCKFLPLWKLFVFIFLFQLGLTQWPSPQLFLPGKRKRHDLYNCRYRLCWKEKGFVKSISHLFNLSNIKSRKLKLEFFQGVKDLPLLTENFYYELSHVIFECCHQVYIIECKIKEKNTIQPICSPDFVERRKQCDVWNARAWYFYTSCDFPIPSDL